MTYFRWQNEASELDMFLTTDYYLLVPLNTDNVTSETQVNRCILLYSSWSRYTSESGKE